MKTRGRIHNSASRDARIFLFFYFVVKFFKFSYYDYRSRKTPVIALRLNVFFCVFLLVYLFDGDDRCGYIGRKEIVNELFLVGGCFFFLLSFLLLSERELIGTA